MVRLKVAEYAYMRFVIAWFQFLMVRLKGGRAHYRRHVGGVVSIPYGSIKSSTFISKILFILKMFQFLMVRLKGVQPRAQGSCGTTFQFLMVRLKVGIEFGMNSMPPMFQFLMVRLKGPRRVFPSAVIWIVSIPYGSIKSQMPEWHHES